MWGRLQQAGWYSRWAKKFFSGRQDDGSDMQRYSRVSSKNPIAHERLVTLACWPKRLAPTEACQRSSANLSERALNGRALTRTATERVGAVLLRLLMVAADNVASPSWFRSPRRHGFSVDDRVGFAS